MENKKPFEKVWTFENFCSAYKAAFKHKRYRNTEDGKLKYKYYSTQRPVGTGTYPKPAGNPATAI